MSFLTFLCIASVVYLCAADPIGDFPPAISDQDRVDKFMASVEKAYDEDITPLLAGLSDDDRDYMKDTTLDGMGSFVNYCIYRAQQNDKTKTFDNEDYAIYRVKLEDEKMPIDQKLDDGFITMQFSSPANSFSPVVPYNQPPVPSPVAQ